MLTGNPKLWKPENHFRQQKAAFDERKGIIDPNSFSGDFYHNCVNHFCGKKTEKFVQPLGLSSSANPLWQVTASYGTSIFYKEIKK